MALKSESLKTYKCISLLLAKSTAYLTIKQHPNIGEYIVRALSHLAITGDALLLGYC